MGDYSGIGDGIVGAIKVLFITVCISVPLAIWKMIDIIIWICKHLSIDWV